MPVTDWNWFFSSVAQSAAAIVGIFGAFIVTKILSSQSIFAEKRRRMRELTIAGEKLCERISRLPFDWYHRENLEVELDSVKRKLEKDPSLSPEALYEQGQFSRYLPVAQVLEQIGEAKVEIDQRLAREFKERQLKETMKGHFGVDPSVFASTIAGEKIEVSTFRALGIGQALGNAQREIDDMYAAVRHHIREAADFFPLVELNSESSRVVMVSLLLILMLFFSGVIYPLSFMPVSTAWVPAVSISAFPLVLFSLRGAMLSVVALLFTIMLSLFFVLDLRLRFSPDEIAQLEKYTRLASYSPFFANRDANSLLQER